MASETIDSDLSCARCGYNLRTLVVAGLCPECGEAVALSLKYRPFRFGNPETPKRVRNGLALFIVAVLANAIFILILTGAMRLAYVVPPGPYRLVTRSLSYGLMIAQLSVMLGLILATWPYGRRGDRFARPLGVAVLVFFSLSAAPDVVRLAHWVLTTNGSVFSLGHAGLILGSIATCAGSLAPLLAWIHLMLRVRYGRNRPLWLVTLGIVLVHFLLFASSVSVVVSVLQVMKYVSFPGTVVQFAGPTVKSITLVSLLRVSGHRISAFASLVTIGAIWLYLRRLRTATSSAGDARCSG